ncbi:hypothetical protein [Pseudonocardia sp. ICBG601]|uniref:hypothetical protein n=1 Tax=Pseudonocardia sp. ICBG601 TaxID=2846759 RepID=UPI001CF6CF2F|nr:hypothetical protein [Pseudonocardia sp. ICBG601]
MSTTYAENDRNTDIDWRALDELTRQVFADLSAMGRAPNYRNGRRGNRGFETPLNLRALELHEQLKDHVQSATGGSRVPLSIAASRQSEHWLLRLRQLIHRAQVLCGTADVMPRRNALCPRCLDTGHLLEHVADGAVECPRTSTVWTRDVYISWVLQGCLESDAVYLRRVTRRPKSLRAWLLGLARLVPDRMRTEPPAHTVPQHVDDCVTHVPGAGARAVDDTIDGCGDMFDGDTVVHARRDTGTDTVIMTASDYVDADSVMVDGVELLIPIVEPEPEPDFNTDIESPDTIPFDPDAGETARPATIEDATRGHTHVETDDGVELWVPDTYVPVMDRTYTPINPTVDAQRESLLRSFFNRRKR